MKKNLGGTDRVIRLILAAIFAVLYFSETVTGTFGYILLGVGGILVVTSLVNFCPLYAVFGINTCAVKKSS